MTRPVVRLGLLAAVAAVLISGCMSAQAAATQATAPAAAKAKPVTWHTCTPRAARFDGAYRIYNDEFAGRKGRFCIRSTGRNLTTENSVIGQPGGVVAYPAIQYGPYYGYADTASGLPVPELHMGAIVLHVSSTGHAAGQWTSDVDAWFYPNTNTSVHANYELVIINRTSSGVTARNHKLVKAGGQWYEATSWTTCPPGLNLCWPLIWFEKLHQSGSLKIRLGVFAWDARKLGWLPKREWIGNWNYGSEIWSGGKGLTDSMTVRWTTGLPVIRDAL